MGRPFAWKDLTCAFLAGFSLSLNDRFSKLIFDIISTRELQTTQNDDPAPNYPLGHQAQS